MNLNPTPYTLNLVGGGGGAWRANAATTTNAMAGAEGENRGRGAAGLPLGRGRQLSATPPISGGGVGGETAAGASDAGVIAARVAQASRLHRFYTVRPTGFRV